jgi:uncharacterized protein with GYD domain
MTPTMGNVGADGLALIKSFSHTYQVHLLVQKHAWRCLMKTFVLVTKLASRDAQLTEIGAKLSDRSRTGRAWLNEITEKCPEVKFKAHYALMGYWDSMHIYEAPNEETAAKVSLLTRPYAAQVESWLALPFEKIIKISEDMESSEDEKKP